MFINLISTGQQIRQARQQSGLSQATLARLAEVSRATIIGIENGTIKEIGVNRLNRIVAASQTPQQPSATCTAVQPAARKSKTLALSFPYDWSNPNLSDSALIAKVVERGLFEDMVKVAVRYGIAPLRRAVATFTTRTPEASPGLSRMLTNIESALRNSPLPHTGQPATCPPAGLVDGLVVPSEGLGERVIA